MNHKIPLTKDTIDHADIDRLCDWLKTYPQLTKGPMNEIFEKKWSEKIGVKYSVFVNSGSSALLLMLYALKVMGKLKSNNIVTSSVSWVTDVTSISAIGLKPILCDCNLQDLSVDLEHLEDIFKKYNPAALILVSVLGFPPNMDAVKSLCEQYGVHLLEDVCESVGSEYNGKKLGTFGLMSCFSTYFSHHISTIEGGIISCNDFEIYEALKMLRSHGWARDVSAETKASLMSKWDVDEFNSLYRFFVPGLNLRSTDLNAFLGIYQLDKLDSFVLERNNNYKLFDRLVKNDYWKPIIPEGSFVSNFCYPIIHPERDIIVKKLTDNNVTCRPLISGSIANQPFFIQAYGKIELKNASIVDKYGLYVPNYPGLTEEEIKLICEIINSETA